MKYQKFVMVDIKREDIHGADYNPRIITDKARTKLKSNLKKHGLLQPIVVNKQTFNIVSGHQRLSILDEIEKQGYSLQVAMVDLSEEDEIKANVFMNNQSAMGEWDFAKLSDMGNIIEGIDFEKDFGFEKEDLQIMGLSQGNESILDCIKSDIQGEELSEIEQLAEREAMKNRKAMLREKTKGYEESGDRHMIEKDDYVLSFVFNSTTEKHDFMKKIKQKESERFIKASFLFRLEQGEYNGNT